MKLSFSFAQGDLVIMYEELVTRHDSQSGYDEKITEDRLLRIPVQGTPGAVDLRSFLDQHLDSYIHNLRKDRKQELEKEAARLRGELEATEQALRNYR